MSLKYISDLSEAQCEEIVELAAKQRREFDTGADMPIANDIFMLLEKQGIILTEYPVARIDTTNFSAMLLCIKEDDLQLIFIGLNTADYFDKQIFAIAHEFYHLAKKDLKPHISRQADTQSEITESMADRFAAEFLLPQNTLKSLIIKDFQTVHLQGVKIPALLRFIARIHCVWWLPYKSIVKRLYEAESISDEQYKTLYSIDERKSDGDYFRIGLATDEDTFSKLNEQTGKIGTAAKYVEKVIRNYEDGFIGEMQFIKALKLFGKVPEDFGLDFSINESDLDELATYVREVSAHED